MNSPKEFRDDITGLRAIAVIPVLLFHAKVPFMQGGFLGVDIFFVVSGYLIFGNILKKINSNTFSFFDFYDRRIRRIIPALLLVLLFCIVVSPFFMVPYDIKNLGQSVFASAFSANNILLYLTSGYWSLASDFKPLYHTWSLGVEEQFYLFIPILLIGIAFFTRNIKVLFLLIFSIFVISFFASLVEENVEYNFLIIFTRGWELLAGGLLAIYTKHFVVKKNNLLAFFGILLIGVSFVTPDFISNNQAVINLPPVIGAILVISFAGNNSTFVGRCLSVKPMIFIGLTSYSIYLWHQPLLAFYRLASEYEPSTLSMTFISLLSIPFAYVSWRFVENPARNYKLAPAKVFYPLLFVPFVFVATVGLMMHKTYGFQNYFEKYSYGVDPQKYNDGMNKFSDMSAYDESKPIVIVLGNSFARDFINMMVQKELDNKFNVFYDASGCSVSEERIKEMMPEKPKAIILASNWAQDQSQDTVSVFEKARQCNDRLQTLVGNVNLYMLGAKNFGWNNNFVKMYRWKDAVSLRVKPLPSVLEFNLLASEFIPNYIDVLSLVMDDSKTVPVFTSNNRFITYDTNHVTPSGAEFLGNLIFGNTALSFLLE